MTEAEARKQAIKDVAEELESPGYRIAWAVEQRTLVLLAADLLREFRDGYMGMSIRKEAQDLLQKMQAALLPAQRRLQHSRTTNRKETRK
ncbi:MAG: hypothetical protein WBQ94_03720 [Terracidiphilus sp.]